MAIGRSMYHSMTANGGTKASTVATATTTVLGVAHPRSGRVPRLAF